MTAGITENLKMGYFRVAGIGLAGLLAATVLCGGNMPARAAEARQDTLSVASLDKLSDESLGVERGGAFTSKFNLHYLLNAIATVKGETKFQMNIPEAGTQSQSLTQVSNTTVTQTNSANLNTGPVVTVNVVVGP